jgi:anti-sigma factor RsiW
VSVPVAYLLGELDDAQVAEFERAMTADPELREEVARLRSVVSKLARVPGEAWENPEPPPLVLPPDAAPRRRARWWTAQPRRLVLPPLAAVACGVVLLAAGIGLGVWLDRDPTPEGRLVLAPVGDRDPRASGRIALADDGVTHRVRVVLG